MTIKNVSGETRYFGFGQGVRGLTLANNGTATVPDNNPFILSKVQGYVNAGSLQVTSSAPIAAVNTPANFWVEANGAVSDAEVVVVLGVTYEFANDPGAAVLGAYHAGLSDPANKWAGDGAAAATALGTLRTAINNNSSTNGLTADAAVTYDTGLLVLPVRRTDGSPTVLAGAISTDGVNMLVSGATMTAGVTAASGKVATLSRAATAGDVTAAQITFVTGLTSITAASATVKTAAGVPKAWVGAVLISGGNVVINNVGGVDYAATDIVTIEATGV